MSPTSYRAAPPRNLIVTTHAGQGQTAGTVRNAQLWDESNASKSALKLNSETSDYRA